MASMSVLSYASPVININVCITSILKDRLVKFHIKSKKLKIK